MMETLWMIEPWHWLVLGFILLIIEMFVPTFASLWFGAAAIIVAALTWLLPISISVQIIIWLILSAVFLVVWFKFVQPLSVDRTKAGLGGSVIIGETGMIVIPPQSDRAGVVRFSVPIVGAAEWMCRTTGEVIAVGERVIVTDIVGNELIVSSMQPQSTLINKRALQK
ncbi:NfeD family protein [Psychrobacter sp. B38]|uniref:NfeD family protein n=1 Tax=Psychrobacter sp. B38 TaxID=3143538 RepID=UPI0032100540